MDNTTNSPVVGTTEASETDLVTSHDRGERNLTVGIVLWLACGIAMILAACLVYYLVTSIIGIFGGRHE